ncbi:hypothetical protein FACS189419_05070 [Planctomycetales bacterium]|nr:hypothetical protein FACS189419_05070 [Planctomycetales bacterium]
MQKNNNKTIQVKLLKFLDKKGICDKTFDELADILDENENDINEAVIAVVNRNFIKCQLFEDSIENAVVLPDGLQYIKDNTVQLLPIRRRISDLWWNILTHGCTMLAGFILGVFFSPFFTAENSQTNHNANRQGVKCSEQIVPAIQGNNSADSQTKKESQ